MDQFTIIDYVSENCIRRRIPKVYVLWEMITKKANDLPANFDDIVRKMLNDDEYSDLIRMLNGHEFFNSTQSYHFSILHMRELDKRVK